MPINTEKQTAKMMMAMFGAKRDRQAVGCRSRQAQRDADSPPNSDSGRRFDQELDEDRLFVRR